MGSRGVSPVPWYYHPSTTPPPPPPPAAHYAAHGGHHQQYHGVLPFYPAATTYGYVLSSPSTVLQFYSISSRAQRFEPKRLQKKKKKKRTRILRRHGATFRRGGAREFSLLAS